MASRHQAGLILLALTSIAVGFRSAWRKKDQPSNTVQIIGSGVDPKQVAKQVGRYGRQS